MKLKNGQWHTVQDIDKDISFFNALLPIGVVLFVLYLAGYLMWDRLIKPFFLWIQPFIEWMQSF